MPIRKLSLDGTVIKEYLTAQDAAKDFGCPTKYINRVLSGKRKTYGGYRWEKAGHIGEPKETNENNKSWDETKDAGLFTGSTFKNITTLEKALEFAEVDLNTWEVDRWKWNSWQVSLKVGDKVETRTNYQVSVWFIRKKPTLEDKIEVINNALKGKKTLSINYVKGLGTITLNISDLHIGAEIEGLVRTPDFNVDILCKLLKEVGYITNDFKAENVHVNMYGDFFESLSGMNHLSSFKSIGRNMWGANVIMLADTLISDVILSNVTNLRSVNIIGGNHDRMTASNQIDSTGEGAKLLSYILQKNFPKLKIDFNSLILVKNIDGLNYLMTHGDKSLNRKHVSKVIFDYGDTNLFNLLIEGHLHTRRTQKTLKSTLEVYDDIEVVGNDELKYRKMTLPALFTGNSYSENLGYAGTAGAVIIRNNGKGYPIVHDYTI